KAKLAEARVRGALGNIDLHGGNLSLTLSERMIDVRGEILLNGVPAKLAWQRRLDAGPEEQQPLKIIARLDNADRETLGLAVNDMISGDVPVVVTVKRDANGKTLTSVQADLGGAELFLETLPWQKPPGRAASLRFDVARGKDGRTELQNFKITGDDIAIEGWVALDAKNQLKAFYFPEFTLNVITQMDVSGRLREDGVLEVRVKSASYDGRPFFRALLTQPRLPEKSPLNVKNRSPLDLVAEIDTMVGFTDTNLRNVKVSLKRRGNRITALEAAANFSTGGAPLVVSVRASSTGHRIMTTETTDAGSAFRLIGFYGSIRGGEGNLRIDLDGQGHADKTGILQVRRFAILGDEIVTEVLKPTEGNKRVMREQFPFDLMRVSFETGHGQIVLGESYLRGPIIGATLRGRMDYQTQTLALGGTYVPLSGFQGAFHGFPVLGELMGEGLFGITFAIEGPMAKPNVLVNPLSLVTPGILRGIFDMAPPSQTVQPRQDQRKQVSPPLSSSLPPISTEEEALRKNNVEPTQLSPQSQQRRPEAQQPRYKVEPFEPFKSDQHRN
ncbi:MAG: AsmA-like C-terminal region-containing protein, partial [Hyphomicrobiaceae bacterium]